VQTHESKAFRTADGSSFLAREAINLCFQLGKTVLNSQFFVVENLPTSLLFGVDLIYQLNLVIDVQNSMCKIGDYVIPMDITDNAACLVAVEVDTIKPLCSKLVRVAPVEYDFDVDNVQNTPLLVGHGILPKDIKSPCILLANTSGKEHVIYPGDILAQKVQDNVELACVNVAQSEQRTLKHTEVASGINIFFENKELEKRLSRKQQKELFSVLKRYKRLFEPANCGVTTTAAVHNIDTGESTPIGCAPYQTTPEKREFISKEIENLLTTKKISPSTSPWASPVVLVKKKDGSVRFCIDYRKLNAVSKRDCYPMTRIDDALASMKGMIWFSSLDLAQGYWQVPMDSKSKEKTAFISHDGLYEFNVMPFGLTNAPATFQRMMDLVLAGVKWQTCLVYLDDIIIFSKDFESHMADLTEVLRRLSTHNLMIKPQKCALCLKEIKYLGHIVSGQGIKPDPDKVYALQHMRQPENLKQLQSFLGFTNYYKRFVKRYSQIAAPLNRLQQKNVQWKWGKQQENAFQSIKQSIQKHTLLVQPDWSFPFILDTDGSKDGLGVVLSQVRDGIEEPIAFDSRTLTVPESKWHCCEFEALAAVWGTRQFHHFLADRPFTLRVDHHNLRWLKTATKSRLQRWGLELQEYQYGIEYRRGIEHCNCDGLSRNPVAGRDADMQMHDTHDMHESCGVCSITNSIPESQGVTLTLVPAQTSDADIDDLRRAQLDDETLRGIIERLCTSTAADGGDADGRDISFCFENDLLFYIDKRSSWFPVLRLCVPKGLLRTKALRQAHSDELAAHLGFAKTYSKLCQRFYWAGMKEDTLAYVKSCHDCQLRKTRYRPQGLLHPIQVNQPWEIVGMDLYGELPCTKSGNQWILVFIDHYTKYPEIIPLRKIDAASIADCIHDKLICRHGCPMKLLSDRGPQFLATPVKRLCKRYGINKVFTTAYHPQGDPQAENFMKVLGDSLTVLAHEQCEDWDKFCESIAFAYRTAIHPTTRYTPFFLTHLREAKIPADRDWIDSIALPIEVSADIEDKRWKIMCKVRNQVGQLIKQSQSSNKVRYDTRRSTYEYKVGQHVLLRCPKRVGKLQNKWQGPFCITQINDNGVNVTIRHSKSTTTQNVHVDRITPFYTRDLSVDSMPESVESVGCTGNQESELGQDDLDPQLQNKVNSILHRADTVNIQPKHLVTATSHVPINSPEVTDDARLERSLEVRLKESDDKPIINLSSSDDETSSLASDEYEVEKILGYDSGDDEPQYRVRWKGYTIEDDTWEPLSKLENARDAVKEFHSQWNLQNPTQTPFPI
jgi:hypothetical protein